MTSIADALAHATNVPVGVQCKFCAIIVGLPKEDADAIRAEVAGTRLAAVTIAKVLQERGLDVKADAVSRHRRGECART